MLVVSVVLLAMSTTIQASPLAPYNLTGQQSMGDIVLSWQDDGTTQHDWYVEMIVLYKGVWTPTGFYVIGIEHTDGTVHTKTVSFRKFRVSAYQFRLRSCDPTGCSEYSNIAYVGGKTNAP